MLVERDIFGRGAEGAPLRCPLNEPDHAVAGFKRRHAVADPGRSRRRAVAVRDHARIFHRPGA